MAYGGSNDDVIDDVTMTKYHPNIFKPLISKTAQDRLGCNGAPIENGTPGIEWSCD